MPVSRPCAEGVAARRPPGSTIPDLPCNGATARPLAGEASAAADACHWPFYAASPAAIPRHEIAAGRTGKESNRARNSCVSALQPRRDERRGFLARTMYARLLEFIPTGGWGMAPALPETLVI